MRIIIAPARKMARDDSLAFRELPALLEKTELLRQHIVAMSVSEQQKLWQCSDRIARESRALFETMNLKSSLTPALLAYQGIQYQTMAPGVFDEVQWDYVQQHLRILSGFYGVLKPLDGIVPYRLEMKARLQINDCSDLYAFWKGQLLPQIRDESGLILDLASKEYSQAVCAELDSMDQYIRCTFGELEQGKVVQKGVYAKMARGAMVRYLASEQITDLSEVREFKEDGYHFESALSDATHYVFVRETEGE